MLILTIRKPIRAATSQTISRWIKLGLKEGGIDTDIYSSYSTRHAATSAAYRAGVNIDIVRKAAGWTEKSEVFSKFYNKPLINKPECFARGVLEGSLINVN